MSFLSNDELAQRLIALGLMNGDGEWLGGGLGSAGGLTVVGTDPVSPANGDAWILVEGTTPTGSVTLKIQNAGSTLAIPLAGF